MGIRMISAAVFALLAALTIGAAPSLAEPDFAGQTREAPLTSTDTALLQKRTDSYRARLGGTQIATNTIDLDGRGTLVVATPGKTTMCPYGNFCAYSRPNYKGDMLALRYCHYFYSMPFAGYGSFLNNQHPGATAHFYGTNRRYVADSLRSTSRIPHASWTYIHWVKPCGPI